MKKCTVQCPAKINLTLEIVNRRDDGFHNIKSIMQMVSLYDYLDIELEEAEKTEILLDGNSDEVPYDNKNLVYKAAQLFLEKTGKKAKINIYINKNIPVSAGLAGGSTDAAGTIAGLNRLLGMPLDDDEMHKLCAQLGSDLNVCLEGGCLLATSRGEKIEKLKSLNMPLTIIKPRKLGISAKEAYTKYSLKKYKPQNNMTEKMIEAINNGSDIREFLYNDLEYAVFDDYDELQQIKRTVPYAIMSGSGSAYFTLEEIENVSLNQQYQIIKGLHFIPSGVNVTILS